jgi:hypothetical protein
VARGQRIIPGWLRERTRFCAACLVLSLMLACAAVVINRGCTAYSVPDGSGGIAERTRSDGDIKRAEKVIVVVGGLVIVVAAFCLVHAAVTSATRPRRGYCRHCGYDLTGLMSGRCPECGTVLKGRYPTALDRRDGRKYGDDAP